MRGWRRREVVHEVTDARPSLSEDIGRRERNYLIKMGIRLVCLVLAFTVPAPMAVKLLLFAGVIFLPYIAVVGANAPRREVSFRPGDSAADTGQNEIPRHRREIGS
ncbi:DUF3099 domain-containing protein [Planomonospora corallina]|uniref:DUF3099 domain-containing protein n=1 Tax=Planomonospora corallina TaxID=1806052 RepID=A0ABV8IDD1_9ACTN